MFDKISDHADDSIESLYLRAQRDTRDQVLNLGIGVYRDEQGNAPIFNCVQKAEQRLLKTEITKGYMSPFGNERYIAATEELVLGREHPVLADKRIISAQCPGAGAGLRVGAELAKSINPDTRVWFSSPVWDHQVEFFSRAGLPQKYYSYYDPHSAAVDFQAMLKSLESLNPGDLVVIHGCCHNPTGADLSLQQWQQLTDFLIEKQAVPFVDIAYQGYGTSVEEDVKGAQYMASKTDNMLLTVSSSKSFAVYRDRAGLVSIIHSASHTDKESLARYFRDIIRGIYFMPPNHAAAVIAEILTDQDLRQSWRAEMDSILARIKRCRHALADAMATVSPDQNTGYLRTQLGMFSSVPVTAERLQRLEEEHRIYLLPIESPGHKGQAGIESARINFAAMTEQHAEPIARALCSL